MAGDREGHVMSSPAPGRIQIPLQVPAVGHPEPNFGLVGEISAALVMGFRRGGNGANSGRRNFLARAATRHHN